MQNKITNWMCVCVDVDACTTHCVISISLLIQTANFCTNEQAVTTTTTATTTGETYLNRI